MSTTKVADSMLESGFMKSTDGVLSGTITGTYIFAGNPTIAGGVASADPTAPLGLVTKQYVDDNATINAVDNPIINPNMTIWQRGTSFPSLGNTNSYTADRWRLLGANAAAVVTVQRSTTVPTVGQAGVHMPYSLQVDVTTADAAPAANESIHIDQAIEGANWGPFWQRDIALSFWVRSPKSGTHCVSVTNFGNDRAYVATYTVAVADTWERITIAIPASPSAGTWDASGNARGLLVRWVLEAGTDYHTTPNVWGTNGNMLGATGMVNVLDNVANNFYLTGVQLALGSVAGPLVFRGHSDEMARCERYYEKSFTLTQAPAQSIATGRFVWLATLTGAVAFQGPTVMFKVRKPISNPTITIFNPSAANSQIRNTTDAVDCTVSVASLLSESMFTVGGTGNAGMIPGDILAFQWTAEAEI